MSRAMKDSGIPWIGIIPSHWRTELIGSCIKEVNNPNTDNAEDNALQFKMGTIIPKKGGDSKYNPESLEAYNKVCRGDIIINGLNLSFDLISQRVGLVKEDGVITSTYLALRPLPLIDSRFLNYLFKGYDYCKALHSMGRGLRATLGYNEFRKYFVIFPSILEQQAIADFLDKKCSEIDDMVSLQEKIIEELKAYKQSVITEAVCKGLNPDVPMKDSEIEWEGKVPQTWQKVFLKWYFSFEKGKNAAIYTADYIGQHEGSYVVYSGQTENEGVMGRIDTFDYDIEECLFTTTVGGKVMTPRLLHGKFSLSQNCLIMKKKEEISNHFIYYLLMALFAYEKSLIPSYMQPSLRIEDLKTYTFFLPQYNEQQFIADFLDEKCNEIDALISLKQSKIEALKEYKKSIIYEYITGKKEVSNE